MEKQVFRKLKVWEKSMVFMEEIYKYSQTFPKSEEFGLRSQLRRSATSIALNIAEGSGSGSIVDFNRFLSIALRSSYEVICAIEIASRLNYFNAEIREKLLTDCNELAAMITGLKKRLIIKKGNSG